MKEEDKWEGNETLSIII